MRNKSIVICIGLALVLMSLSVASAEEGEVEVEVEMEVMPDMFVLSANSPWLELDVYDPGLENYPSFEYLNDTDRADELGLNETEFYAEITNSTGGIIFSSKTEFDRFEIKRSETTGDFVLAIMVARSNVTLDSNSPIDDLDSPLKIEVTGIITYPETEGNQSGDVKFKATDSVVDVKLQGEMPEKAGGGDKGKHAATSETNDVPTSEVVIINADEPACELVTEPVVVSALVSPLTIMLESKCPMFGMEVKDNANSIDADTPEFDFARYDVQDMNDKFLVNIELGVILTADDGIYGENGNLVVGAVALDAIDLKDEHDEYEISPTSGNLVLQYTRNSVFNSELGYDSSDKTGREIVTVGAFLESSCSGEDMTGSVPFYIRGVFEDGLYEAGTEFYGESDAIVMGNSQSKKKGGQK